MNLKPRRTKTTPSTLDLEHLYYETKPLLILGIAFITGNSHLIHFPLTKFSVLLLLFSGAVIIHARLVYRGYFRR